MDNFLKEKFEEAYQKYEKIVDIIKIEDNYFRCNIYQ